MFGLTPLGAFHTAISLIAVAAGLIALIRDKEISPRTLPGKVYVVATIVSCVTGLGIFHHGGFGAPHVLSIITLAVLGVAVGAGHSTVFGRASRYVETVSYSATSSSTSFPVSPRRRPASREERRWWPMPTRRNCRWRPGCCSSCS